MMPVMSHGPVQIAPGELELVREFVNTRDVELASDRLDTGTEAREWMEEHGLAVGSRRLAAGDLERLHDVPTGVVLARLRRERGFGPWSCGVVCLEGLGRFDHGKVGDLALIKLASALRGRWVEASETAELLAPYGEWQGLAGFYLMAGYAAGLVPGADRDGWREPRRRAEQAA